MRNYALLALVSMTVLSPLLEGADRVTGLGFATRSEVIAPNGMAATSQPLATQIALDILKAGGSAVDAAIAANAALGLMEPTGSGIGGDLFAIVWDAETEQLHGLNASGRSPRGLTLEEFQKRGLTRLPKYGPLTISVPGCVDGWFELHEKFGKLPMSDVLAPAICYARDGFPVSELIAFYWDVSIEKIGDQPGFKQTFLIGEDGRAPRKGELFRNAALADTLQKIANGGRDVFYRGELAKSIDAFMRDVGGFLRYEDLDGHRSEWVEPIGTEYRGHTLWELPPNGQGIAALQILNILEGFDLRKAGYGSPEHLHLFIEAKKLAFEDRAKFYADPDFAKIPIEQLVSKAYAASRRSLINPERAAKQLEPGDLNPALESGDTIYLTVADSDGNMVSLIQSNYRGFGSGLCPEGLGFCLQSRGELFDLSPGRANSYAPGKRPFHTIIPAFITKASKPWISFGVMGGATQPQAHAQIMMNLVDFDMNLQEAGDAPRIIHSGSSKTTGEPMDASGGTVYIEEGFPFESVRSLMRRGHKVARDLGSFGGYQAIRFDSDQGVYYGASESRKDGQAAGY